MCSAILSVSGKNFDVDRFLDGSALRQSAEKWTSGIDDHTDNGFQIIVEDQPELDRQITGIISFTHRFMPDLKRLSICEGVEEIDFRIAYFWNEGVAALAYKIPTTLNIALAQIPASLTFCVYPCSKESDE